MKKIALAAGIALAATAAHAKYDDPIIEPEIIIEDTSSSAAGWVVPLMLLVVIAAIAASNTGTSR